MFFSPRDKSTALGMHTPLYFFTLAVFMIITIVCIIASRKMSHKVVKRTILIVGVFLWITEFIKMIFTGVTYGIEDVEPIPLYFCSMFMYASVLNFFKNEYLKNAGLSFMFFGGILGAVAFFCYPSAVVPNYHLFHFMTLRTFIYHSLMIYVGILIVITGYYKPNIKHFKEYSVFMGITFILAYIINNIEGINLMYISEPLEISLSEKVYEFVPNLYPFIFGILQLVVPFFVTYGVYKLIEFILYRKNSKIKMS